MSDRVPRVGALPSGPRDAITDVSGVTVGHCTLAEGAVQTGVTVIRPHAGDLYHDRVPAAAAVLNGFGKSIGLMQLEELGVIETPIALTNTFGVPAVAAAQIRAALAVNPGIGRELPTVNPLVFECNDGHLNDMARMVVAEAHYRQAHDAADVGVPEGAVGAGRGMSSFGVKGGIGTASRRVEAGGRMVTVGTLVLANFGRPAQLRICGRALGPVLAERLEEPGTVAKPEKGSIILIAGTDAPLDARQLRRLALRAGAGLARTGSVFGHGSGDIALAFSTAYTLPQDPGTPMPAVAMLHDGHLDPLFEAVADGIEQAILNALWRAETVTGRNGHRRRALAEILPDWQALAPGAMP
ncbi:D-aminopeptidase [Methylobacterium indicum]|uniref:DmpA family aminopeptidase n=1 Tax=Methylobacterium indicum TaxID=1775910 RepID=UPI0007345458|nr:P1 family peptidase [Methylobacterium indicum]KTS35031.1 D-aminopeptidase [Methylobacterium indicum]KTS36218.1 D-aminopeptidase [Methylobacterium indicum]KTS54159.1 D-aminopeptidase [Methylobacterium indicum]